MSISKKALQEKINNITNLASDILYDLEELIADLEEFEGDLSQPIMYEFGGTKEDTDETKPR